MKTWMAVIIMLPAILAGSRSAAGDRVFLETGARNAQTGAVRVAVCLDTDKPLVCFSVKLTAAGERRELGSATAVLNEARLPWKDRAVNVEAEGACLAFSVADLSGENVMVKPGKGWVFAVDLAPAPGATAPEIRIEEAKAFDRNGNEIKISSADR
jgi:hypothetical protein